MKNKKNDLKPKMRLIFTKYNVFRWLYLIIKNWLVKPDILHEPGSHIITAYPGGGKTLLMSHIISEVDSDKYFFLSNLGEFAGHDNVYTFKIEDIFKDNEQALSFPRYDKRGRKLYGVIFDEINLTFNKRLNKRADYNDIFIGLIEFLVSHRHQDVPRVYFLGQKLELQDTQLQSLFKIQHDIIKCKKFPKYRPYNKTGKLIYYPVKLKIINRRKATDDTFMDISKYKVKIVEADYNSYDTQFLGKLYSRKKSVEYDKGYPQHQSG